MVLSADTPARRLEFARFVARIALYTALGTAAGGLERLLPTPLPWIRLGLANGVALLVLYRHGFGEALIVNLQRALLVGLLMGTWASPALLLSLAGGAATVFVMAAVRRSLGRWAGPVGVSAVGAFTHMTVQFLLAALLLVRSASLLAFAGPSLIAAVVSGVLIGIVVALILPRMPEVEGAEAHNAETDALHPGGNS
jgi:heptaprenyl diphosphate synthase